MANTKIYPMACPFCSGEATIAFMHSNPLHLSTATATSMALTEPWICSSWLKRTILMGWCHCRSGIFGSRGRVDMETSRLGCRVWDGEVFISDKSSHFALMFPGCQGVLVVVTGAIARATPLQHPVKREVIYGSVTKRFCRYGSNPQS